MSVVGVSGGGGIESETCRTARQYVRQALEGSTEARSPQELAEAYQCSGSHMRNVLSEMKADGEVEAVEYGLYELADGETGGGEDGVGVGDDGDAYTVDLASDTAEGFDTTDEVSESDASEGSSDGSDGGEAVEDQAVDVVDVEESEGMSAGTALVGATLGLAVIVLVTGRSGSSSASVEEVEEAESDDGGDHGVSAGPVVES